MLVPSNHINSVLPQVMVLIGKPDDGNTVLVMFEALALKGGLG